VGTNRWGSGGEARTDLQPVFSEALARGINFFDTAEIYGRGGSERTLGSLLAGTSPAPVVLTKFFPMPWRLRRRALLAALKRSLGRLGLPRVEVYLVHFPTPPMPIDTWVGALADAVHAGLARAVGVSNYSTAQMRRAHALLAAEGVPLACNEVEYNLLRRDPEKNGTLEACRELGVTLIAYRPLALGFLTAGAGAGGAGMRGLVYGGGYARGAGGLPALLARIGDAHGGKSASQVALNWLLCKGALPIPGATSVGHLRENLGALGWRLAPQEVSALDAAQG
jgi:aryl-alcohol dehydrogenase-like predicted oxidoreductase